MGRSRQAGTRLPPRVGRLPQKLFDSLTEEQRELLRQAREDVPGHPRQAHQHELASVPDLSDEATVPTDNTSAAADAEPPVDTSEIRDSQQLLTYLSRGRMGGGTPAPVMPASDIRNILSSAHRKASVHIRVSKRLQQPAMSGTLVDCGANGGV